MHLLTLCHISLERVSVSLLGLMLLNRHINGARLLMSLPAEIEQKINNYYRALTINGY